MSRAAIEPEVGRTFRWDYHKAGEHGRVVAVEAGWVWFLMYGPKRADGRATFGDVVERSYWDTFAEEHTPPAPSPIPLHVPVGGIALPIAGMI